MASIFTKILNKELPCYKIFEDELSFSILTLDQINLGHSLVIPKKEINSWLELPQAELDAVYRNAQKIGRAIQKVTSCPRVLQAMIGFEVPHVHLHLIPAWSMADMNFSKGKKFSDSECRKIQEKLISNL